MAALLLLLLLGSQYRIVGAGAAGSMLLSLSSTCVCLNLSDLDKVSRVFGPFPATGYVPITWSGSSSAQHEQSLQKRTLKRRVGRSCGFVWLCFYTTAEYSARLPGRRLPGEYAEKTHGSGCEGIRTGPVAQSEVARRFQSGLLSGHRSPCPENQMVGGRERNPRQAVIKAVATVWRASQKRVLPRRGSPTWSGGCGVV